MTLDEYQTEMLRTAGSALHTVDGLLICALGICGEGGEAADIVKKHVYHGHPLDRAKLIDELGDVLWYVARMSEALCTTLDSVAAANISKLRKRYPEGFSSERSINRLEEE